MVEGRASLRQGRRRRNDVGATALEYGGILIMAGVIFVGLAQAGVPGAVTASVQKVFCQIFQGNCAANSSVQQGQPVAAQPGDDADQGGDQGGDGLGQDRRDAGRDTRNERTRPGDDDQTQPQQGQGTAGGEPFPGGLGDPVPGTQVTSPRPPEWTPPDGGAGEHGSWSPSIADKIRMQAERAGIEAAAHAASVSWPNASRNLLHYFGNSGDPLEQDVDRLLDDVGEFADTTRDQRQQLGAEAVERAKQQGATGPITFPVNTAWAGFGYDENGNLVYDNSDWFYAMGGWSYNQTGQVTVYPPSRPGGQWRYEVRTRVNIRDRYNWDGGKGVNIGPISVSDDTLAKYHRAGWAQEYTMDGQSDVQSEEGTAP